MYAALSGFHLSELGTAQAAAAAGHLATSGATLVITSPLDRAVQTAAPIAATVGAPLRTDERLTEWGLARRWAGVAWSELSSRFPGEVEAYMAQPTDLPFADESIHEVAIRMEDAISDVEKGGVSTVIVVSHQDPVQALRLRLTGRELDQLGVDKPGHAGVVTLHRAAGSWVEVSTWAPPGPTSAFPPSEPMAET